MVVTGKTVSVVEVPDGVQVDVTDGVVTVRHGETSLSRRLAHPRVSLEVAEDGVHLACEMPTKRERALVRTFASHVRNLVRGVTEGFTYTLKLVYAHFPVKVSVRGDRVVIENFLGERHPRTAKIRGATQVEVRGDTLTVTGPNREDVGQTAANIEQATRIKNKDPRVFQDGIYIVSKGGEA